MDRGRNPDQRHGSEFLLIPGRGKRRPPAQLVILAEPPLKRNERIERPLGDQLQKSGIVKNALMICPVMV